MTAVPVAPNQESDDSVPALALYPGMAGQQLTLTWRDNQHQIGVQQVILLDAPLHGRNRWRFCDGLSSGTPIEELNRLNGKPFPLFISDTDGGSFIRDWNGGRLAGSPGCPTPFKYDFIYIEQEGKRPINGGAGVDLMSDDPRVRGAGIVIDTLWYGP